MFLLWEGPNGSPVRRSKLMKATWRLVSSMRRPKGRWGGKLNDLLWWMKQTALSEKSWTVWKTEARRFWLACYHTRCSGVICTGALQNKTGLWFALEAEYLPKGRFNGCSHCLLFSVWLSWILLPACRMGQLFWLLDGRWKALPNKYLKRHNIAGLVWQRAAPSVSVEASCVPVRLSPIGPS